MLATVTVWEPGTFVLTVVVAGADAEAEVEVAESSVGVRCSAGEGGCVGKRSWEGAMPSMQVRRMGCGAVWCCAVPRGAHKESVLVSRGGAELGGKVQPGTVRMSARSGRAVQ